MIEKIQFPYFLKIGYKDKPIGERVVVFFGTDFYNIPVDSDRQEFIEKTNTMLRYAEKNLPGRKFLYQPHPNEKDEYDYLDLGSFKIGEKTNAEIFLYDNADSVEYVFSAISGTSVSAYAMGFNSAMFLELCNGAVSEETIIGYRSYFAGFPDNFSIKSFDASLPVRKEEAFDDENSFKKIYKSFDNAETVWFIGNEPGNLVKAIVLAERIKKISPSKKIGLIKLQNSRWHIIEKRRGNFGAFEKIIEFPYKPIRSSIRPKTILAAIISALFMKKLPIKKGHAVISFSMTLFEENAIISSHRKARTILFIGAGWYQYIFENGYKALPKENYKSSKGVIFFDYILQPLLGLYRVIFQEYRDGKVINYFRYRKPLEKIYDSVFVLAPDIVETRKIYSRKELSILLGAPALLIDNEIVALQRYAATPISTIVEIGVAFGASALLLLLAKKDSARVYSIDPFIKDSMGDFQATEKKCRKNVEQALHDSGLKNKADKWSIIPDYSYNAVKNFKEQIDLIFIDGDHRYEAVKKDFEDWFPLVKNGGFILFHDSSMSEGADQNKYKKGWPGPSRLVRELKNDKRVKFVETVDSLNIFKK